jgi:type 1 glutamine amidotransferase
MKTQLSDQTNSAGQGGLSRKIRALVLCGDGWHPGAMIRRGFGLLTEPGYDLVFLEDGAVWSSGLMNEFDLVVLAKCNVISGTNKTPWLMVESQSAFPDYLHSGHGLLVIHAGTAGYQDCTELCRLTGGRFLRHPEPCAVDLLPRRGHPVVAGVNPFMVHDEHYFMALEDQAAEVFLHSQSTHGIQPAGWTRPEGRGRVCVLTPGHTEEVWLHPMFQLVLRNALHWTSAKR